MHKTELVGFTNHNTVKVKGHGVVRYAANLRASGVASGLCAHNSSRK
jgi:hypothetical protein